MLSNILVQYRWLYFFFFFWFSVVHRTTQDMYFPSVLSYLLLSVSFTFFLFGELVFFLENAQSCSFWCTLNFTIYKWAFTVRKVLQAYWLSPYLKVQSWILFLASVKLTKWSWFRTLDSHKSLVWSKRRQFLKLIRQLMWINMLSNWPTIIILPV